MSDTKKHLSILWLTGIFSAVLAFATQTVIARNLNLYNYGLFASMLTSATIIAPLAGFGACKLLLKIFGQDEIGGVAKYKTIIIYILGTTVISLTMLIVMSILAPHTIENKIIQMLFGFHIISLVSVELITANNQIRGALGKVSAWQLMPNLIRFTIVVTLVIVDNVSIFSLVMVYLVTGVVCLIYASIDVRVFEARYKIIAISAQTKVAIVGYGVKNSFKDSWPYGLASFAHLIIYQSDIIVLSYLDTKEVTGLYNISFLVLSAIYLLPAIAYQKFYLPLIHKWSFHEKDRLIVFFNKSIKIMLVSGAATCVAIFVLSDFIIKTIFGVDYSGAAEMLRLLSLSIPFMFIAYCCGPILSTKDNITVKIKIMILVALVNVVLNLIFIPKYSYVGACVSTIICSTMLGYYYYKFSKKILNKSSE